MHSVEYRINSLLTHVIKTVNQRIETDCKSLIMTPINIFNVYTVLNCFTQHVPVNGAVMSVASEIRKSRHFSLTHGGILDTRDVVGIRKGINEFPYRKVHSC